MLFFEDNGTSNFGEKPISKENSKSVGLSRSPLKVSFSTGIGLPKISNFSSWMNLYNPSLEILFSSSANTDLPYCFLIIPNGT